MRGDATDVLRMSRANNRAEFKHGAAVGIRCYISQSSVSIVKIMLPFEHQWQARRLATLVRCTFVWAFLRAARRPTLWSTVAELAPRARRPCFMNGDFAVWGNLWVYFVSFEEPNEIGFALKHCAQIVYGLDYVI